MAEHGLLSFAATLAERRWEVKRGRARSVESVRSPIEMFGAQAFPRA